VKQFLLEIGTEELPPSVIRPAAIELEHRIRQLLTEHNITLGPSERFYTPRRIAVRISAVAPEKPAQVVEIQGPPKKVAFTADGKPTKTASGFAAAQGKTVADIYVKPTPRGEYVFVKKELAAVPTAQILKENLPAIITSLSFPKNMRWQEGKLRFSRPIRWLLCLFDSEPLPFNLEEIVAGNRTFGHRNFTPRPIVITRPEEYVRLLEEHKVIASPAVRLTAIQSGLKAAAAPTGGEPFPDRELVDETVNITEWPEPILCSFSPDYLPLPNEVLTTALKMHQRCFAVVGAGGRLLPYFIAVANTPHCDQSQVRRWYEKAVESRLRDARFFVEADRKLGLEPLVEEEKRVIWIEGLGTLYDKTCRLRQLCGRLATVAGPLAPLLDRAAYLCKADLLTQVVREKEFTSLQGTIGGIYARLQGEPEAVCTAIAEHYLPRSLDDKLPASLPGALLSIADKLDNIVATFLTGAIPTGSEDPFALRRQATGLLMTILAHRLAIDLSDLLETALALFPKSPRTAAAPLADFFKERLAALLREHEIGYDVANAVLATTWHRPKEALARAQALLGFRPRPEFEKLIIGQKRVANILRGQAVSGPPEPQLFVEDAEKELWHQSQTIAPELERALAAADYQQAFALLLSLRGAIDKLFDDVLVMAEDAGLRLNRLRLLKSVHSLFLMVADLSEIVLEGETTASSCR